MEMKHKALVLGGNADQVPLIEALRRRGYHTVLVDYYPDPPGKAVADVHHQVSTLDMKAVCAVVEQERPRFLTSIGNDLVVPMLAAVSERYGLPCTQSHADAVKATNKSVMKATFRDHQIPTAREFTKEEYTAAQRAALPFPLIGKLLVGYGARGVRRLNSVAELDAYLAEYADQGEVLVEAFIDGGAELSVDCFAVDGQVSLLLISRLHQVPGLHQQFSNLLVEFPYAVPAGVRQRLEDIAQRMAGAFGIANGPFFFQTKLKDDVLHVIEMGARIAGGRKYAVIQATTGFDPLEAQLDVLEGRPVRVAVRESDLYFATAMLFARPGTVAGVQAPSAAQVQDLSLVKGPGFVAKGTGTGDDRIAVLTTRGAGREAALDAMRAAIASTHIRDAQGEDLLQRELYAGPW